MDLETVDKILIVAHVIGTIIGVGAATMVEMHLNQSLRDKLVSTDEKALLGIDYQWMRIGLITLVLSGFGFLILAKVEGENHFYSPRLWAKLLLVVVIAVNTLLLQAHAISLYWGTAFSFASWWGAAFVGMFITHQIRPDFFGDGSGFITPFATYALLYAILVIGTAIVLHKIRSSNVTT